MPPLSLALTFTLFGFLAGLAIVGPTTVGLFRELRARERQLAALLRRED